MSASHSPARLDFDQWATLARQDPESFETERARVIDSAIRRAPLQKQQRLRCLQWKLDQIRKTSGTPMLASLRMNRLLWEAVAGKNGLVERLNSQQAPEKHRTNNGSGAKILSFPE